MIPKIIHQFWLGNNPPRNLMRQWTKMHPLWEYRLWTQYRLPKLYCQKEYDKLTDLPAKSDVLRYELMYRYGGIWADTDTIPLQPFDEFLTTVTTPIFLIQDPYWKSLINGGIIGSRPYHPFWMHLLISIKAMPKLPKTFSLKLGPKLLKQYLSAYSNDITVFPFERFMQPTLELAPKNAYSVHFLNSHEDHQDYIKEVMRNL